MKIQNQLKMWYSYEMERPSYFFPNPKALAKVFRAKLLQAIVDSGLKVPADCPGKWVVDCKNVGNGSKAVIYLGQYLYRGVIREKDIIKCENGMVTFRYHHARSNQYRTKTVTGEYFLYLLTIHILPKGFRRTRDYGFLHHCSKKLIRFLQMVLKFNPFKAVLRKLKPEITCPACGKCMKIVMTMVPKPIRQPPLLA